MLRAPCRCRCFTTSLQGSPFPAQCPLPHTFFVSWPWLQETGHPRRPPAGQGLGVARTPAADRRLLRGGRVEKRCALSLGGRPPRGWCFSNRGRPGTAMGLRASSTGSRAPRRCSEWALHSLNPEQCQHLTGHLPESWVCTAHFTPIILSAPRHMHACHMETISLLFTRGDRRSEGLTGLSG